MKLSYFQIQALSTKCLGADDPNNYLSSSFHDWWLDRADFYNSDLMPNIKIVEEIEELKGRSSNKSNEPLIDRGVLKLRNEKVSESRSRLIQEFATML